MKIISIWHQLCCVDVCCILDFHHSQNNPTLAIGDQLQRNNSCFGLRFLNHSKENNNIQCSLRYPPTNWIHLKNKTRKAIILLQIWFNFWFLNCNLFECINEIWSIPKDVSSLRFALRLNAMSKCVAVLELVTASNYKQHFKNENSKVKN